jgi:hypothetical protein
MKPQAREHGPSGPVPRGTYNSRIAEKQEAMEADRVNLIENTLHDLTARAAELRRYL